MKEKSLISLLLIIPLTSCSQSTSPLENKIFCFDTMIDVRLYEGKKEDLIHLENLFSYYDIISDVIGELTESNYRLNFMLESDISTPKPIVQAQKKAPYFKDASINKKLTFDNFVVGNFNREASQAALLVASNPGKMYNPLFLYSKSGLGKTHLMQSIGNYILQNGKQGTK